MGLLYWTVMHKNGFRGLFLRSKFVTQDLFKSSSFETQSCKAVRRDLHNTSSFEPQLFKVALEVVTLDLLKTIYLSWNTQIHSALGIQHCSQAFSRTVLSCWATPPLLFALNSPPSRIWFHSSPSLTQLPTCSGCHLKPLQPRFLPHGGACSKLWLDCCSLTFAPTISILVKPNRKLFHQTIWFKAGHSKRPPPLLNIVNTSNFANLDPAKFC